MTGVDFLLVALLACLAAIVGIAITAVVESRPELVERPDPFRQAQRRRAR